MDVVAVAVGGLRMGMGEGELGVAASVRGRGIWRDLIGIRLRYVVLILLNLEEKKKLMMMQAVVERMVGMGGDVQMQQTRTPSPLPLSSQSASVTLDSVGRRRRMT